MSIVQDESSSRAAPSGSNPMRGRRDVVGWMICRIGRAVDPEWAQVVDGEARTETRHLANRPDPSRVLAVEGRPGVWC